MTAQTRGMNRVDPYHVPNSPIARIMSTADQATARRQAIDAIRELHRTVNQAPYPEGMCEHCDVKAPCQTIATLDRHRV